MSTINNLQYEDRLIALGITNLNIRRKRVDLIQLYKFVHGMEKIEINKSFSFLNNNFRGHSFKYRKEITRLPESISFSIELLIYGTCFQMNSSQQIW